MKPKQMTVDRINDALDEFMTSRDLGPGSLRRSSWYVDYAAFDISIFDAAEHKDELHALLSKVCNKCGWCRLSVISRDDKLCVVMHRSALVDARQNEPMPHKEAV